jgi:flagellin
MLGITQNAQAKSSEKLSSGYRINRAADDAAGLSISEKMRSQIRGLTQASRNAQDGISLIQTAEGALNEVHSMLQRMNELATQAANDTNETVDRTAIESEISALVTEIERIGTDTEFNNMKLFDGNFDKKLQVGAKAGQVIGVAIDKISADELGIEALDVSDNTKAGEAMTAIQAAIETVSTQRSGLGAIQNRLEHTINNLDNVVENTTAAESRIRDTDMAEEMVEFSKNNILAQAGQAMLAQANMSTQGVLSLLS